ncbi:dTDP-4-dehydrorhamnose 3,5-epimerase family protein [Aquipuribacter sp. SD81]|uniref:dTDP-4-dehydrorhamnose 3,5-epimerase family protein n=1 Tax=Aquipuribacter sp. SD81 TaxID=3127703 RepID=UPI00301AAFD0
MQITPLALDGAALVALEPRHDDRGFFARSFCRAEFTAAGLEPAVEQVNVSCNTAAGTLRGLHWQTEPAPEAKLVRCTRGAVADVVVDVRPGSPTYLQHVVVELTAANRLAVYVPPLCAHGYLTLEPDTEVTYQVSAPYTPGAERGLRYDDPALGIVWPGPVRHVSDKDLSWEALDAPGAATT